MHAHYQSNTAGKGNIEYYSHGEDNYEPDDATATPQGPEGDDDPQQWGNSNTMKHNAFEMAVQRQEDEQAGNSAAPIDETVRPENDRFPYCIVWTALPIITWFLPFIGHTGIATAEGVIHDFAGPYFISVDDFAFGAPLKYMRLDASKIGRAKWNRSVLNADKHYKTQMHNICCNNCHSHVARALNEMEYMNKKDWTMVSVWFLTIFKSTYVSYAAIVKTYLPFAILFAIFLIIRA